MIYERVQWLAVVNGVLGSPVLEMSRSSFFNRQATVSFLRTLMMGLLQVMNGFCTVCCICYPKKGFLSSRMNWKWKSHLSLTPVGCAKYPVLTTGRPNQLFGVLSCAGIGDPVVARRNTA